MEPVHFLLVDDLEENLLALEALLRRDGLELHKARSGAEALELLLKHEMALALVDVQMPEMDGFELAELMRGTERTKAVPIIFLTAANADQQRWFRGYEAGAVDFLHKPLEANILKSKAGVFFELYRQRQEVARQRDELKAATDENSRLLEASQQYAEALQEADRRKDEFLATLAHELRNPLAPIRNGLQILRMDPQGETAEEIREMMDRQLTHMVRLIDDLLDMSRVSQGKIELRKKQVSMQEVVKTALEASNPLLESKRHRFVQDIPKEPIWIEADLTRMAQVVSNLLNNAAKYTPEEGEIRMAIRVEDGMAVVEVSDNGTGLEPSMLESIFDLFTQVSNSMDQSQGGLGIGLALTRHLMELHGGSIQAESAGLGHGSTFSVRQPVIEEQQEDAPLPALAAEEGVESLNVLAVDDNVESAKTIGWMLELLGHKPTLAHSGEEAIALAKELHPQAILLDIGLPDMTGYDVCRTLREDEHFRHTLLIAQTGWGQKRDRELAHEAGFDHHLIKPVDMDELAELLKQAQKAPSAT